MAINASNTKNRQQSFVSLTRMHSSRMRTVRSSSRRRGEGLLPEGAVCSGGVYSRGCSRGGCLLGGVSAQKVSAWEGGVSASVHARIPHTPAHTCGQTHRCKNITFATSLRTVTIQCSTKILLSPWANNNRETNAE